MPTPGTVVPSGSEVSPSGDQGTSGIQGAQGPQGTPSPNPNQSLVVVGTVPEPNFPNATIIPSLVGQDDAIWTPYGQYDDHFDGTTLNPKWAAQQSSGLGGYQQQVINSKLHAYGGNGADGALRYVNFVQPFTIPATQRFQITGCLDLLSTLNRVANGVVGIGIGLLRNTPPAATFWSRFCSWTVTGSVHNDYVSDWGWASSGTVIAWNAFETAGCRYFRVGYSSGQTTFSVSVDGFVWWSIDQQPATAPGFNTNPPDTLAIIGYLSGNQRLIYAVNWFKFDALP